MQMDFDVGKLWLTLANLSAANNISYARGTAPGVGKIGNLDAEVPALQQNRAQMDCSGFITYVLYQSTRNRVKMSGGTMSQQDYLKDNKYREYRGSEFATLEDLYSNVAGKIDDTVRIGFRATDLALKRATSGGGSGQSGVGLVWLTINAMTFESTTKGTNNGPASFPYSVRTKDVDAYFLLGSAPGFSSMWNMGTP